MLVQLVITQHILLEVLIQMLQEKEVIQYFLQSHLLVVVEEELEDPVLLQVTEDQEDPLVVVMVVGVHQEEMETHLL